MAGTNKQPNAGHQIHESGYVADANSLNGQDYKGCHDTQPLLDSDMKEPSNIKVENLILHACLILDTTVANWQVGFVISQPVACSPLCTFIC